ncbi:hypothetical protein AGABI1DRAFT_132277 [Agaricus bisporus var. burnettii JB137-S8]|uniref:Gylcosyl hydrolase 115 C-terminal domain-containing protein n=1 Tax=Agaricus bisporus var. burnettii (strain JB137-S8 / ATCC MYA-4627 / FGSC 10392) TaxID=597362 RepID=K5WXQ5_AGABU|nr:uncharacterized protein AGABI1DRAFT_132277 [Agaricus bisporus var. burnettii JB137-S8]EKM75377.1 hypothetical protein AGABI1DRAFT_132277 [Agaricus bisporus var. burnettii JB137-S8]
MLQGVKSLFFLSALLASLWDGAYAAIGAPSCVAFRSASDTFPIVNHGHAAPVYISSDDWPGVQRAAGDFVADIQRVTGAKPALVNLTLSGNSSITSDSRGGVLPVFVGTLGRSALIDSIVNSTGLDVSGVRGQWEAYLSREVKNPIPGVDSGYVIVGADKRGTIFALYEHSEQFGVSPWYWWADVPITKHSELHVKSHGCSHGTPTVKYRGIFLNDEQPCLQSWAMEKFTNGTGSPNLNSPFNHLFYAGLFELLLRLKANYLWPAMWGSAFALDDSANQFLADYYGIAMGTSHQEPMMRATPNEFTIVGKGSWDYTANKDEIYNYWLEGTKRAESYESVFTLGMRGFGDLPLSETTDIELLEGVIDDQTTILKTVFGSDVDLLQIPQIWTLYQEVEGYYDDGMRVPDYVTLLWADDLFGNVRRYPVPSERNRTGGAGVYYHLDLVGGARSYKWVASSQIPKIYEQMSIAVDRVASRLWVLNVGDLKPYERDTEFFLTYGWNASRWNPDNLDTFVSGWAQREFDLDSDDAHSVADIVANLSRFNSRRKPELWTSTTYSLIDYREAQQWMDEWGKVEKASTDIYSKLPDDTKPAFFQLVHHPVSASANAARMLWNIGMNNLRSSQAFLSTNDYADTAEELFEHDWDFENDYHTLLDGKWDHMMDQTHLGYYYWQQPMTNSMNAINRVQKRKQALAGYMRISVESSNGAWPGDNPNQCAQGYNCPPPTVALDSYSVFSNRYIDIGAGGPASFSFKISSNTSWVDISPSSGDVSPQNPEKRVFLSVKDWSSLSDGANTAQLKVAATSKGQPSMIVTINFSATRAGSIGDFHGFVEGDGVVSMEAAHATRNTTVDGISWKNFPGLGRTLSGVTPWPRSDQAFDVGTGPTLEYDFFTFNTIAGSGNITVTALLSPSNNAQGQDNPLTVAVALDSEEPIVHQPMPDSAAGKQPAAWDGVNGFAANNIIPVETKFTNVSAGKHTFKIMMTQPAIVVQKIVIDVGGLKPSYLGPPESHRV